MSVRPAPLLLAALALCACHRLPDLGDATQPVGPPPALLPLDELLAAPAPTATATTAEALLARATAARAAAQTSP